MEKNNNIQEEELITIFNDNHPFYPDDEANKEEVQEEIQLEQFETTSGDSIDFENFNKINIEDQLQQIQNELNCKLNQLIENIKENKKLNNVQEFVPLLTETFDNNDKENKQLIKEIKKGETIIDKNEESLKRNEFIIDTCEEIETQMKNICQNLMKEIRKKWIRY